jgi:hypothetical protein
MGHELEVKGPRNKILCNPCSRDRALGAKAVQQDGIRRLSEGHVRAYHHGGQFSPAPLHEARKEDHLAQGVAKQPWASTGAFSGRPE